MRFAATVCTAAFSALCARSVAAVSGLTPLPDDVIAERAIAAILGGFIADAAAMPLHWEYNTTLIAQLVGGQDPAFYPNPLNIWYNGTLGGNTPYGQQNLAYLKVGATTGALAPTDVEAAYWSLYNPAVCPGDAGGWYLDASTREFIANEQAGIHWPNCGGNDNQADAVAHMIAVVALLGGNTTAMLDALDPVIRVTQAMDDAAAFGAAAARLFERVLVYNQSVPSAINATISDLRDPARYRPYSEDAALADKLGAAMLAAAANVSNFDFVLLEGQSCDYPHTLPNIAQLAATLGDGLEDFRSGVRQTILAGGDSGSRGVFIGALQGARLGSEASLPSDWASMTTVYPTVKPQAEALVAHRRQAQRAISKPSW